MRCTCNRSVVALTSASSTRRTMLRSLDQRCSRHLLYSPDIEYFDSAKSKATAPSSTTIALWASAKKSDSVWLRESEVIPSILHRWPAPVCDAWTWKLCQILQPDLSFLCLEPCRSGKELPRQFAFRLRQSCASRP